MTPTEALNQLTMCALGKCAVCVHSEEGECFERILKARDIILSAMQTVTALTDCK